MYLSKNKKRTPIKGFTLIELMVVISIIGFLSSIVLASLNVAREKARISSGVQFNASLIHRYAQVAYYNFNDSTPNDQAGKNNGVITGPVSFSSDTFSGLGKSASFNGGEITIPDDPSLDFNTSQSFALSAWIKTTDRNHIRIISKGHWGFSPGYVLQIHCCDSNGNEQQIIPSISNSLSDLLSINKLDNITALISSMFKISETSFASLVNVFFTLTVML